MKNEKMVQRSGKEWQIHGISVLIGTVGAMLSSEIVPRWA
jgi:hypothetical protein